MTAIECQDISLKRGKVWIFKDISLSVKKGQFVALIGHNGAGKSSLIKMLLGLIAPSSGKLSVLGNKPGAAAKKIGYLPENVSFYENLTVQENLNYFADLKLVSRERVKELVETLGLAKVSNQKVSLCSKGQRQRLGLAQALLTKPELLFLDEPTVGLDPLASDLMYSELVKLKNSGSTVVVCTHELLLVEDFIDRAVILCNGVKVADGTLRSLSEQFEIPYEMVSSKAVEAARTDDKLSTFLRENRLFCPANKLEKVQEYLEMKYGIKSVGVVVPSLLDIYKKAIGMGRPQ